MLKSVASVISFTFQVIYIPSIVKIFVNITTKAKNTINEKLLSTFFSFTAGNCNFIIS